jgi:hypothetical protein
LAGPKLAQPHVLAVATVQGRPEEIEMFRIMLGSAALLILSGIFTVLQGCSTGGQPVASYLPSYLQPSVGALALGPARSDYAPRKIGTSSPAHIFTLRNPNTNNGAAVVNSVQTTDSQFAIDSATTTCGQQSSLPIGGTCQAGVRYAPTAKGATTALLEIATNATNSPHTATLTGTGR